MEQRLNYPRAGPGSGEGDVRPREPTSRAAGWSTRCSSWSRSGPRRSTAAPSASTCTRRTPARRARRSSGSTRSTPGARRPFFTERERAALAWAEAVTRIGDGVPDDLYAEARQQFSEKELVDLTWAVAAINAWNRVAISFRSVPGSYQPTNDRTLQPRGVDHEANPPCGRRRCGPRCRRALAGQPRRSWVRRR